jgi:hypothetical protein
MRASDKNVAVLIGSPNGLPGVPTDIRELTELLDKPDFHFRTVAVNDATTEDIFATVKEEAADADSFLFYFSGHGNRGVMLAEDRTFTFNEVVDAVKEVRQTPFERMLVLIDSCYSGSFVVDGDDAIVTEPGSETGSHLEALYGQLGASPSLYQQAFVFSAAKDNETSLDLGAAKGGAFTYKFRTTVEEFMQDKPMATFREVATEVSKRTEDLYDHTPMWRGFPAADVMDDYFFVYRVD